MKVLPQKDSIFHYLFESNLHLFLGCVATKLVSVFEAKSPSHHDSQIMCSYPKKPELMQKAKSKLATERRFKADQLEKWIRCLIASFSAAAKVIKIRSSLRPPPPFRSHFMELPRMVLKITEPAGAGVATLSGSMIRLMNGSQRLVINQMLHSPRNHCLRVLGTWNLELFTVSRH